MSVNDAHMVQHEQEEQPPVDKFNLNYYMAIMLGAGTLLAYNAVIAGSDYYQESFKDRKLEYYAPLATSAISPLIQFSTVHINKLLGKNACAYITLIGNAISVAAIPILVANLNADTGFIAALICMLAIGGLGAVNLSTMFSYFAVFPFHFLQALMAGQGVSGVLVSVLRAITKAIYQNSDTATADSARLYFAVAGIITFLCVVAFTILRNTEFSKYYLKTSTIGAAGDKSTPLLDEESGYSNTPTFDNSLATNSQAVEDEPVPMLQTLRTILPAVANVSGIFIITFLCFPGLMLSIKPTVDIESSWFSVINILLFNVFDLVGRTLPSFTLLWNEKNVHVPVIIRMICFPLFVLAAKSDIELFNNTYFVFGLICFFAVSNGYLSSIVMMTAGNLVADKEKEVASSFMSASLTSAIFVGAMLAVAVDSIAF